MEYRGPLLAHIGGSATLAEYYIGRGGSRTSWCWCWTREEVEEEADPGQTRCSATKVLRIGGLVEVADLGLRPQTGATEGGNPNLAVRRESGLRNGRQTCDRVG